MTTEERFWSKVDRSGGPDACWPWRRAINESGYGVFWPLGLAHRFAWEQEHGPIPEGAHVDHVCHNGTDCPGGPTCPHRRCCNVRHLEPTTPADNNDRSHNWNGHRTHCAREGHPLSGGNVYVNPKTGGRSCRVCRRAAWQRHAVKVTREDVK
jgi:hypothetical protein